MTVQPPRHVIRFYGNPQYALESIRFKEITFLHRDKLNDPFDPPFYFLTDFDNNYEKLIKHVKRYHSGNFQLFKQMLPKESWENYLTKIEKKFSENSNGSFIFSTSGIDNKGHPRDSLYMWGHYGKGFRGVAIEFDTTLLKRAVLKSLGKPETEQTNPIYNVHYQNNMPRITCESIYQTIIKIAEKYDDLELLYETELFKILNLILSSKSVEWKKEKEWRFILRDDKNVLKILKLCLEDDAIIALYLGCRTDDQVKDDLIFETKHKFPKAKIYESKMVRGDFKLKFELLS